MSDAMRRYMAGEITAEQYLAEIRAHFRVPPDSAYECSRCGRVFNHPGPCGSLARWFWRLFGGGS